MPDSKSSKNEENPQVGTLTFLAPSEIDSIAQQVAELLKENPQSKDYEKKLDKFCKAAGLLDGADIALFGRMVASLPSLTLEGAAMFSHALSTHKADNDLDFYSAVDDRKPKDDDAGAGMIGTLEFSSAVYYRYAGINLDLLADADHLAKLSVERAQTGRGRLHPRNASGRARRAQKLHERPHPSRLRARHLQACWPALATHQCV